jgi:hypothetical protein
MQCNKHLQLQLSMVDIGVAKFTHWSCYCPRHYYYWSLLLESLW